MYYFCRLLLRLISSTYDQSIILLQCKALEFPCNSFISMLRLTVKGSQNKKYKFSIRTAVFSKSGNHITRNVYLIFYFQKIKLVRLETQTIFQYLSSNSIFTKISFFSSYTTEWDNLDPNACNYEKSTLKKRL